MPFKVFIDKINNFIKNVTRMRELQNKYCLYTTDISSNTMNELCEVINRVDDFIEKTKVS